MGIKIGHASSNIYFTIYQLLSIAMMQCRVKCWAISHLRWHIQVTEVNWILCRLLLSNHIKALKSLTGLTSSLSFELDVQQLNNIFHALLLHNVVCVNVEFITARRQRFLFLDLYIWPDNWFHFSFEAKKLHYNE